MIRVEYGGKLEVRGSKVEIMSDISVILHSLKERGILTEEDIETTIKYAKLSDVELQKAYQDSIKASKKELMEAFSKLIDELS